MNTKEMMSDISRVNCEGLNDKTVIGLTLLVKLKLIHKKFGVLGLKDWWIDSEAIQPGSADKTDEGRHYHRSVRLHKQSLEALIRYRILRELNVNEFSDGIKNSVATLREDANADNLGRLMKQKEFQTICKQI